MKKLVAQSRERGVAGQGRIKEGGTPLFFYAFVLFNSVGAGARLQDATVLREHR